VRTRYGGCLRATYLCAIEFFFVHFERHKGRAPGAARSQKEDAIDPINPRGELAMLAFPKRENRAL